MNSSMDEQKFASMRDGTPGFVVPVDRDGQGQLVEIPSGIELPWGPCLMKKLKDGTVIVEPKVRSPLAQVYHNLSAHVRSVLRTLRRRTRWAR